MNTMNHVLWYASDSEIQPHCIWQITQLYLNQSLHSDINIISVRDQQQHQHLDQHHIIHLEEMESFEDWFISIMDMDVIIEVVLDMDVVFDLV